MIASFKAAWFYLSLLLVIVFADLPIVMALACVVLQYSSMAILSFGSARSIGLQQPDALAVMFCSSQVTITVAAVMGFSYFQPHSVLYVIMYHLFQQAMGQFTAQLSARYGQAEVLFES